MTLITRDPLQSDFLLPLMDAEFNRGVVAKLYDPAGP